jgi:hypothetical protein
MVTLRIEHAISDYDTWKAAFDRDPVQRQQSGVRRFAIHRPTDDPHYVMIDLEFDDAPAAQALLARMRQVWQSPAAAPALAGAPQARVVDTVQATIL